MIKWLKSIRNRRQERRIRQLETDLEIANKRAEVLEAERDNLAAVVARDRQRIQAEAAAYGRKQAEAEGASDEQQPAETSVRKYPA